jgi:hypothetical protein
MVVHRARPTDNANVDRRVAWMWLFPSRDSARPKLILTSVTFPGTPKVEGSGPTAPVEFEVQGRNVRGPNGTPLFADGTPLRLRLRVERRMYEWFAKVMGPDFRVGRGDAFVPGTGHVAQPGWQTAQNQYIVVGGPPAGTAAATGRVEGGPLPSDSASSTDFLAAYQGARDGAVVPSTSVVSGAVVPSPVAPFARAGETSVVPDIPRANPLMRGAAGDAADVPEPFRCPITMEVMSDPVLCVSDGHTYDREALELWFRGGHRTSPKTGAAIASTMVVPNHALRAQISDWADTYNAEPVAETETPAAGTAAATGGGTAQGVDLSGFVDVSGEPVADMDVVPPPM